MLEFAGPFSATDRWAALGIEPRTSRTQRVNHTTKPSSQLQTLQVCWVPDVAASTAFVEALSRKAEHCELDNSVVVTRKKLSTMIRQQGRFFGSCTAFQMGYGVPRAIPCAYEVHVLAWHHRVRKVSMGEKMGVRGTKKVGNMCCLPAQFSTCCPLCSRTASCATHWFLRLCIHSANLCRAALGIEPRTSRTRSENHTTRPSSRLTAFFGCSSTDENRSNEASLSPRAVLTDHTATMLLSSPRWEAGVGAAEVQGAQRWYRYVSQGFLHFAKVRNEV